MTSANLIENIVAFCQANYNEANVIKYNRYFKQAQDSYGLTATQIHSKVKELLKTEGITFEIALEAADVLIKSKRSEEITLALLLVNGFAKKYTRETFHKMESWFTVSIHNWAHADTLGMCILPHFLKHKVIRYTQFNAWITSNYTFQRRCVPVTLIKYLKQKPAESFTDIFGFIEPLMTDPEREVHQGVGWFLREAWKINHSETEAFLLKWKDSAPRLIIQYATEKMTKDEKVRYKRAK